METATIVLNAILNSVTTLQHISYNKSWVGFGAKTRKRGHII